MKTLQNVIAENEALFQQEALIIEATELIISIMQENGITKAEIARKMGKSKAYVTQCLSGDQNLTLRTVADFLTALQYKLQMGAVPSSQKAAKAVRRLYAVGGWAYEKRHMENMLIDCAASGDANTEDTLCPAA